MRSNGRPRLAVLLAIVYPGLGHVYLRAWGRALLWFTLVVGATVLLVPPPAAGGSTGVEALRSFLSRLSLGAVLVLSTIVGLSALDAYRLAVASAVDEGVTCPACGRDLEEGLAFCHWCSEPLEERNA